MRRPAAVSKAEIQEHLWPDTFVSEANIPTLVAEIRDAIDDDARQPRFIRTVFGFGYGFCGDVTDDRRTEAFRPRPAGSHPRWDVYRSPKETT